MDARSSEYATTSQHPKLTVTFLSSEPPVCYALTLSHNGQGADPVASPANSSGCPSGQYVAGASITLIAAPDTGWQVDSWTGTTNNTSTSTTNTVFMPVSAHAASVTYVVAPPSTLTCESFNAFTPGSTIGTYTGWYDGGAGPVVTAGNGVAGSTGLAAANNVFHWTAHPFNWNAADFQKFVVQNDFRSDGNASFDDDRIGWTTNSGSTSSDYLFGVQLDNPGWRNRHLLAKQLWHAHSRPNCRFVGDHGEHLVSLQG